MPGSTVDIRQVSRRFEVGSEEVWAVRDVTLTIAAGEFVAFIGRSGSGKTTLLNVIAGLDRPTTGEVWIDGSRVDTMREHELNELRRHRIGFVFQSFCLLPLLSAQENVELPLRIAGLKHGERVRRAKHVLDMVGLGRRADHRPYELSGGEQQRVAIARALATDPSLILADEPTGELDSSTATAIFTMLRDFALAEGITIIACTHDRLVMELASRVEELADGRLVTGGASEVWGRVQAKQRSPFAAPRSDGPGGSFERASGLSSLVGADPSQFAALDAPPSTIAGSAEPSDHSNAEAEPEDDPQRWARPDRRR